MPLPLTIYNTLTRKKQAFTPIEEGKIGMKKIYTADIPRKPEWLGW